ncbi:MAG: methylmalonyl Co-A mutase-associated GTPase MeaB [Candidatus Eisenbacteria bacterium]|nr:methylmalonyl Co-A mutase-associated GTPase MeaB [Candidatus Eisenbacteria bacterium]
MGDSRVQKVLDNFFSGKVAGLARAITWVEDEGDRGREILDAVYPKTGGAYRIGISGPPGAGKSTLVDTLTEHLLDQGKTVGIIAVDPTSPFTGGALLGDRIRMQRLGTREGVFIRSMATRGGLGGLSRTATSVAATMDAFGLDYVIFETVGVGQSELDIADAADTTVIVLVPESGDSIQAMKAGLMEIGEIFAVNKADREGADMTVQEIMSMLTLKDAEGGWESPVVKTVASTGEGIPKLAAAIDAHGEFLSSNGLLAERRRRHFVSQVREIVVAELERELYARLGDDARLDTMVGDVSKGHRSPYVIAREVLDVIDD